MTTRRASSLPEIVALLVQMREHDTELHAQPGMMGVPRLRGRAWTMLHRLVDAHYDPRLTEQERLGAIAVGVLRHPDLAGQLVFWLAQLVASVDAGELTILGVHQKSTELWSVVLSHARHHPTRKAA